MTFHSGHMLHPSQPFGCTSLCSRTCRKAGFQSFLYGCLCICVYSFPSLFSWICLANIAVFVWVSSACPPISFMFCRWCKLCKLCIFSQDCNHGDRDTRQGTYLAEYIPSEKPRFWLSLSCAFLSLVLIGVRSKSHTKSYSSWGRRGGPWLSFTHSQHCSLGLSLTRVSLPVVISVLKVGCFTAPGTSWSHSFRLFTDLLPYLKFYLCMSSKQQAVSQTSLVGFIS